MAQIDSANYTKYAANRKVKSRDWGGRARVFVESVLVGQAADTTTGQIAAAQGDCLRMFRIPAGHRLVGGTFATTALGAGNAEAVWIGDFYDCDRFMTSTPTVAAIGCNAFYKAGTAYNNATGTPDVGVGYLFTCDTDILVTFGYGLKGTTSPIGLLTLVMETVQV